MKKQANTICLAFLSLLSAAQSTATPLAELPKKKMFSNLRYIPSKTYSSGTYSGFDSVSVHREKIVSTKGFYISRYEVTNKEYREFVEFIRDSMAQVLLNDHKTGAGKIDWNDNRLQPMMLSPDERLIGRAQVDPGKLQYGISFLNKHELVSVYPDTLVWINDFAYSYNEPLVKKYFSNKMYDNFPVVGINLKQAIAFCAWKMTRINEILSQSAYTVIVRLPSGAEWEAAAVNNDKRELNEFLERPLRMNFGTITDRNGVTIKD